MFIDGFILGGIGLVMPALTSDLSLSATWQGLIGASALIGIFFGGPIGGYLADKIGRKPMFIVDLAVFLLGSAAQFFVVDEWQLFLIRLLMGMAIGADYAIGWPLLVEFSPARLRANSGLPGGGLVRRLPARLRCGLLHVHGDPRRLADHPGHEHRPFPDRFPAPARLARIAPLADQQGAG